MSVVTVALAAALAGCKAGGQTTSASGRIDSAGEPLPGIVKIVGVDSGADGRITYRLENISGKVQEDLSYRIAFRYPETETSAFKLYEWDAAPLRDLVLLKSDTAKEVSADNPRPGQKVLETKLTVENTPPVDTVARAGGAAGTGTLFLERSLECTAMANEDEVRAGTLWIELENVSSKKVSEMEARVVFIDIVDRAGTSRKQAETKWTPLADLDPGARGKVNFDLSGLGRVGSYKFLVKIRQQSL
jgi:hypothetical protein